MAPKWGEKFTLVYFYYANGELIRLLLRIPLIEDAQRRHILLFNLPLNLIQAITFSADARTHLTHTVEILDSEAWAMLPDGTLPLGVMLENVRDTVEGSTLAEEVGRFLLLLQARAPQITAQPDVEPRDAASEPDDPTVAPFVALAELRRLLGEIQDRLGTAISLAETLHRPAE